jgi:hypothetical protein
MTTSHQRNIFDNSKTRRGSFFYYYRTVKFCLNIRILSRDPVLLKGFYTNYQALIVVSHYRRLSKSISADTEALNKKQTSVGTGRVQLCCCNCCCVQCQRYDTTAGRGSWWCWEWRGFPGRWSCGVLRWFPGPGYPA